MYKRLDQVRKGLNNLYENGVGRGYFHSLKVYEPCFSVVLGTTLYVYGPPHTGKTQWILDFIVDFAINHGFKTAISSPEIGGATKVYRRLIEVVAEKDFISSFNNQMSKAEKLQAEAFVYEHFVVMDYQDDQGRPIALKEWYLNVDRIEKDLGIEFNMTLIDPFDELKIDWKQEPSRDLCLQNELIWIRNNAERTGRYHIIVSHLRDQKKVSQKIGKDQYIWYYPAPDPQELAHGQEWYRRGAAMIGLWRPPEELEDEHGTPYESNDTIVLFGKQKPEEVKDPHSKIKRVKVKWDVKRHRYYHSKYGTPFYPKNDYANNNPGREEIDLPEH